MDFIKPIFVFDHNDIVNIPIHLTLAKAVEFDLVDEGENFADAFAGALLIDEVTAKNEYTYLSELRTIPKQINRIKGIAKDLVVSPLTVYFEINKYARYIERPEIDLETNREIYKATTVFNRGLLCSISIHFQ